MIVESVKVRIGDDESDDLVAGSGVLGDRSRLAVGDSWTVVVFVRDPHLDRRLGVVLSVVDAHAQSLNSLALILVVEFLRKWMDV